jgi:hypothetical protein
MYPNPSEPFKRGQWQDIGSVSEPRPIGVDIAAMLRSNAEEANKKKKNAELAKTIRTGLCVLNACLLLLVLALGILCLQRGAKPWRRSTTERQLAGIAVLYRGYGAAYGKPPPNMQALKAWAEKLDKQKRAQFEIDNVETLFLSERDGQPFVLVLLPTGLGPVLAHETTGAHGKRFVVSSVGSVEELDEARFQQAMETNRMIATVPKGH